MFLKGNQQVAKSRNSSTLAGLLLFVFCASFAVIPEVEAACPNAGFAALGNPVELVSCTETKQGTDSTFLSLAVPAAVAADNLLIAVITTDGQTTHTAPSGWTLVAQQQSGTAVTHAVFRRIADGTEPASYTFTWTGSEQAYAYMMRFTGANGTVLFTPSSGSGTPTASPSVTTTVANTLIVRTVGWDDDDYANDPATIMTGYTNITQDESATSNFSASGAAAYVNQPATGASGVVNFVSGGAEEWAAITLGLVPGVPPYCPKAPLTLQGTAVEVVSCTEYKSNTAVATAVLPVPVSVASGNTLIAVINTSEARTFSTPAGWTAIATLNTGSGGASMAVFKRTSTGGEPATYSFNTVGAQTAQIYAYMLRLTGASGTTLFTTSSGATGTAIAPTLNTVENNTKILRLATWKGAGQTVDPPTIISGRSNITQDNSGVTNPVTGAAVHNNLGLAGATGTASFATGTEEWATMTLGIERLPVPFSCPGVDGTIVGTQLILHEECSQAQTAAGTSLLISTPTPASVGDFLIAVIGTDGDRTLVENPAWFPISETNGNGITLGIYSRFIDATEAASYTWTIGASEDMYGYIMRFSGTSGNLITSAIATGTTINPTAASITTLVDNTLAVRVNASDADVAPVNPATIVTGQRNIASNISAVGNGGVGAQGVYLNRPTAGATGAVAFTLNTSEEWRAMSIGLEPLEFRFSHDGVASVCGSQLVTLRATNRAGTTVSQFIGQVTLSATNSTGAVWANPGGLNGTLTDNGNGSATYNFTASDGGVAVFEYHNPSPVVVNFGVEWDENGPTFSENPLFDDSLTINSGCEYRISVDDGSMGSCNDFEAVTIGIYDSEGNLGNYYTGTIDIDNVPANQGNYSADASAQGVLNNLTADDGIAQYTFALGDAGQVILRFTANSNAPSINFNITDAANPGFLVNGTFDPSVVVQDCAIWLSHDGTSDVCSLQAITISIRNPAGGLITNYAGTVTLSTSTGTGDWTINNVAVPGNFVDTTAADGVVQYTFDPVLDGGDIVLNFADPSPNAAINFNAVSSLPGIQPPSGGNDPLLEIVNCKARINVNPSMNVCSPSETVTLTVLNRDNGVPNGAIGTVLLDTQTINKGDFISTTGNGANLNNGAPDDGIATYLFDGTEGGVVSFEFKIGTTGVMSISSSSTYITFDAANSNDALEVFGCEFRISYDGGATGNTATSDVCSVQAMTVSVFNKNGAGVAVTDYVGSINLTGADGGWQDPGGLNGTLVDDFPQDGAANYTFVSSDAGVATFNFSTTTPGVKNFGVTDGLTSATNAAWDPNLTVELCTFRIAMTDQSMTACSSEVITITVHDRLGALSTNFTGTATITTSSLHGNWTLSSGNGILTDTPGDDNGAATYQFAQADGGSVILNFTDPQAESVSVNLVSGSIVEEGGFDPILNVSGCIPYIVSSICFPGSGPGTGNFTITGANPGRMVLMIIFDEGTSNVTNATFNGVNMTPIAEEIGVNTSVEMWGILNADLPGAGSYAGAYSWNVVPTLAPSMCMVELAEVAQAFPLPNVGTPNQGQVNSNSFTPDGDPLDLTTSITTTANNALVLTAAVSDYTKPPDTWFNTVAPSPPMSPYFSLTIAQNPEGGTAGGSVGIVSDASLFTVTDTDDSDAVSSASHIAASFNPRIGGPAIQIGQQPIVFFDTFSGNINYRVIGRSLRTDNNVGNGACNFVNFTTGTEAALSLPAGSTVERAILYWAGSGETGDVDVDVNFGLTGAGSPITADELFQIQNVGGGGNLDYFAAYKDVTFLVSGSGNYTLSNLIVQSSPPWNSSKACAGGWALAVVYSNAQERFRVTNIYHGFRVFENTSFTVAPQNFLLATTDNPANVPGAGFVPNGQISQISLEGDADLNVGFEQLGLLSAPGVDTYNSLINSFNPVSGEFNSTNTAPIYANTFGTGYYEFNATAGINADGYQIFNNPGYVPTASEPGDSWGFDIDTHYIAGNDSSGALWNFAQPGAEANKLPTLFSSGDDLVMLINLMFSVTNFDLADLEIFKSQSGSFKVGGTGTYNFSVVNNGNGGLAGGQATGKVLVADTLPNGLTLAATPSGSDWACIVNGGSTGFTCEYDIAASCVDYGGGYGCIATPGQLAAGEQLPLLTANVLVGDSSYFPLQENNAKNVARMQENGGNCAPAYVAGLIPAASTCSQSPQFDNVNDLQGGTIDINSLLDKTPANNNVDSIVTIVKGLQTDLRVVKQNNGILEVGKTGSYNITVTNLGPDATTSTITVTDNEPAGIDFTAAAGTGWACTVNPSNISCTYAAALGVGISAPPIVLTVDVTGTAGQNITNTAAVAAGPYNFDLNSSNNTESDTSQIVAAPVSSNEKFLMSVSLVPENTTEIGGLAAFQNDDLITYDPLTDAGTLFYDDSAKGTVDDANAVHLYQNGHVALSANGASTVGGLAFQPEDIVVYDPILDTATMLFDGSTHFTGPITADHNIDAVYVKSDGRILFSTAGPATLTVSGLSFNQGDIVEFNPADDSAVMLVDSSAANIFGAEVQVNGLYIRVDDTDASANKDIYILSANVATATTLGACGTCDPVGGTSLTRDDIVELDLTTPANPVTQKLFAGDIPLGVFTGPASNNRAVDAVHVIEDSYVGHFSLAQAVPGSTCAPGQIIIRKHSGLSHDVDTGYTGSVLITTDLGQGEWSIAAGDGFLDNGTSGDGAATYTFAASDNGEVTLYLTETTITTLNVNVTNSLTELVTELGTEDPNFVFNNVITAVTYRDEFGAAAFNNDDGSSFFSGDWVEVDDVAAGPAAGNVKIAAGVMEFTSSPATVNAPEMKRAVDLTLYNATENLVLSFDYSYQFLNAGTDVIVAEVRQQVGDAWTQAWSFSLGGTLLTPQSSGNINLNALFGGSPTWTATTEIRFRITSGYTGTSRMLIDNVQLSTGTTDCGIGSIDHYEIRIDNITGAAATQVPGISCLASTVTITGHDANHFPSKSGEMLTLRALSQINGYKGSWTAPTIGSGIFVESGTLSDGMATYTFPPEETQVQLNYNYTNPTVDPELVNFDLIAPYPVHINEDPTLSLTKVVLRLFNETLGAANSIPTQIAGKASNVAAPTANTLTVQVLTTSPDDTTVCQPLVDVGQTLTFSFALECIDADTCNSGSLVAPVATINGTEIVNVNSNAGNGAAAYSDVDLTFASFANSGIASEVVLSYQDVGNVQLHAQFDVPLNNNPAGVTAGTPILSAPSNVFTVRPFGLDIDFSGGRAAAYPTIANDASYAADAGGTTFAVAGVGFNTTVRAVQYQAGDDVDANGVPDTNAILVDNLITPNFGRDSVSQAGNYKVRINSTTTAPPGGIGALTDNDFSFAGTSGTQTHSMTFDEVGIIDLEASLVDMDGLPINYLSAGTGLTGHARNVGRFYPASLELTNSSVLSRAEARVQTRCINPNSSFTYMGEEFNVSGMIEAQNAAGNPTRNYVDGFAKLGNADLGPGVFSIFEQLPGPDLDLSARRALGSTPPAITWPPNTDPLINRGVAAFSGNLIFNRPASGAPEAPRLGLGIGMNTADSDGAALELDIDLDELLPLAADVKLIGTENFRYGRLLVNNAYGPETEPLGIGFTVEYFDANSNFVVNTDDSCTTLLYDATEASPALRSLFYVPLSYQEGLQDLETEIEADALSNVVVSVFEGATTLRSGVDGDSDGQYDDRPLETSAPGVGNEGRVLVEFNLSDSALPYSLDFLSYDWRGGIGEVDIYDEVPEGANYDDNPRSSVEFGSYRGHDRVLNWQEIFVGSGP